MKRVIGMLVVFGAVAAMGQDSLFKANEIGLGLATAYVDRNACDERSVGANVNATVFPFQKYAGLEVGTTLSDVTPLFNNISVSGVVRYPIEKWHLAPYLIGGYKYSLSDYRCFMGADRYSFQVGAGLEFRLKPGWGIFGDWQHVFLNGSVQDALKRYDVSRDVEQFRVGLRVVF